MKVLIVERVIFHRPQRFPWATREGRARQGLGAGRHGRVLRRTHRRMWRRNLPSGLGRRAPSSLRHHRRRRRFFAAHAEIARGGATEQLSGIWLGLWVSDSGGAAQSASIFISKRLNLERLAGTHGAGRTYEAIGNLPLDDPHTTPPSSAAPTILPPRPVVTRQTRFQVTI